MAAARVPAGVRAVPAAARRAREPATALAAEPAIRARRPREPAATERLRCGPGESRSRPLERLTPRRTAALEELTGVAATLE